jgi:hypothetical protein
LLALDRALAHKTSHSLHEVISSALGCGRRTGSHESAEDHIFDNVAAKPLLAPVHSHGVLGPLAILVPVEVAKSKIGAMLDHCRHLARFRERFTERLHTDCPLDASLGMPERRN